MVIAAKERLRGTGEKKARKKVSEYKH